MGIGIIRFTEYKKNSDMKNLQFHNKQSGKRARASEEETQLFYNYKKENIDILKLLNEESIKSYTKYLKEHMHLGYNGHKEEMKKGDFVLPRNNDTITKIESLVVSPPERIYLRDLENNTDEYKRIKQKMTDYFSRFYTDFLKNDSRYKDIKVLGFNVHMNEVYFPLFDEETKRLLTSEERKERAYIKPHAHIDFLPLTKCKKDDIEYFKLSRKEIHKPKDKGKYFDDYGQFIDDMYNAINKEFGYDRGDEWEAYDERVKKARNGEKVQQARTLYEYQLEKDKENFEKCQKGILEDLVIIKEKMRLVNLQQEEVDINKKELDKMQKEQEQQYADMLKFQDEINDKNKHLKELKKQYEAKAKELEESTKLGLSNSILQQFCELNLDGSIYYTPEGEIVLNSEGQKFRNGILSQKFNADYEDIKTSFEVQDFLKIKKTNPDLYNEFVKMANKELYSDFELKRDKESVIDKAFNEVKHSGNPYLNRNDDIR